jgi:glycosyltransferase involved in cell wall biosynthesis
MVNMLKSLYITADDIGSNSGGGVVTKNELEALKDIGIVDSYGRKQLGSSDDPFECDERMYSILYNVRLKRIKLAHFYAGTFSKTIQLLKSHGIKVTYTAAAHDPEESRKAHEALGISFDNYRHMVDPELWARYLQGYKDADWLAVPSTNSDITMRNLGCVNHQRIIPHGIDTSVYHKEFPKPKTFTVGYLGSTGADKGLIVLLQAWKKAALKDSVLMLNGARMPEMYGLIRQEGGGNVMVGGYVDNVSDFYASCSCYCQPSITEGFGIEVLEALAHKRPVIVSTGAGASDVVRTDKNGVLFKSWDVDELVRCIKYIKGEHNYDFSDIVNYDWKVIRERYVKFWRTVLNASPI